LVIKDLHISYLEAGNISNCWNSNTKLACFRNITNGKSYNIVKTSSSLSQRHSFKLFKKFSGKKSSKVLLG